MTNFKEETLEAIKGSGHKESDVMFIGSADGKLRIDIETFKEISDFTYDGGFGGQEIAQDLIIYFNDKSYMVRGEYDGSEWWEYNEPKDFSPTDESKQFGRFHGESYWESLEAVNNHSEGE